MSKSVYDHRNLVAPAGIVGDGSEDAPNVGIRVRERLRGDIGGHREYEFLGTQSLLWS